MSDIRKPIFVFLLKNLGNKNPKKRSTNKVEVFRATDFKKPKSCLYGGKEDKYYKALTFKNGNEESLYRLRVNGRWFPKSKMRFFYKSDIRNMMFRQLKFE
jgi:hypothetical protein